MASLRLWVVLVAGLYSFAVQPMIHKVSSKKEFLQQCANKKMKCFLLAEVSKIEALKSSSRLNSINSGVMRTPRGGSLKRQSSGDSLPEGDEPYSPSGRNKKNKTAQKEVPLVLKLSKISRQTTEELNKQAYLEAYAEGLIF